MSATPLYFGDAQRPLLGWLHLPDSGRASSGVLICPSLGREQVFGYPGLRVLAERLSAAGMAALRFDYDGTGDSAGGAGDPDRLASWLGSIKEGLAFLRASGVDGVSVVGLRLGSLLAVNALREESLRTLALWDPQLSGRAYLREQTLLAQLTTAGTVVDDGDGSVHGHGAVFPPQAAADLRALALPSPLPRVAERVVVLHRPHDGYLAESVRGLGEQLVTHPVTGMEEMLQVDPPVVAFDAIETLVRELALPDDPKPVSVPPHSTEVEVQDRNGRPVTERLWRSQDGLLFGVLCLPTDEAADDTAIVLLPSGLGHRVGPSRLWVDVARESAARGTAALRLDLSGLGDSATRPGRRPAQMYRQEAVDDIVQAVRELRPGRPGSVRLVGHCSSAWAALQAASEVPARSVHAVNYLPYASLADWDVLGPSTESLPRAPRARKLLLALGRKPWVERYRSAIPQWMWSLLDRTGLLPSPLHDLEQLVLRGTHVQIITDQQDGAFFESDGRALTLLPPDAFDLKVLPVSDHALASSMARQHVASALLSRLGPGGPATAGESGF